MIFQILGATFDATGWGDVLDETHHNAATELVLSTQFPFTCNQSKLIVNLTYKNPFKCSDNEIDALTSRNPVEGTLEDV